MKKQRILFITYENPFLRDNGDRIYTCNFLDALVYLDCDIDIIGYDSQNFKRNYSPENSRNYKKVNLTLLPFKKLLNLKLFFPYYLE